MIVSFTVLFGNTKPLKVLPSLRGVKRQIISYPGIKWLMANLHLTRLKTTFCRAVRDRRNAM
ncbi:MAG: hypothetical protein PVF34_11790, partial [Gammaproteobacteria bacterium]